ncbi:P68 family surface lipoprotein [Mycoplasmopsis opalescens]|uniref:P68 family surface lipoprotein n=1 Tax=Mycoplasmopsis opalescens TaxID=114886 RepID=UPI0004A74B5F|nr:P80 family lipoprotein [Mycoplasmopsis opalescens]
MKNNKLLISLAGSSALLPAFAVACNKNEGDNAKTDKWEFANNSKESIRQRFDQTKPREKNDIFVAVTFSRGKPQYNALEAIIKKFNEVHKDTPGFKTVSLDNVGSGYPAGHKYIERNLNSKSRELPNVIFAYNSTASLLAKHNMLLNLEDPTEGGIKVSNNEIFSDLFTKNTKISYKSNPGTWVLPALKSTVSMGINAPVLSYILETMEQNGVKIEWDKYETIKKEGKNDREEIKKIWGNEVGNAKDILKDYKVTNDTFESFKELLKFSTKARQLFENSSKEESDLTIIGIDDIVGSISPMVISQLDNDLEKYFVSEKTTKGTTVADYSGAINDKNEGAKKLRTFYDAYLEALRAKGLKLYGDGAYSSNDGKYHKLAFMIGSSAGYTYSYFGNKTTSADKYDYTNNKGVTRSIVAGIVNKALVVEKELKIKDGKHENTLHKHGFTGELGYDFVAVDAAANEKIDKAIEKFTNNGADKFYLLKINVNEITKKRLINELKEKEADKVLEIGEFKDGKGGQFAMVLVDASLITKTTLNKAQFLEKNELIGVHTPLKFASNNKKVVYSLGPSFVGIHANKEEDTATRLFAKFLTDNTKKYDFTIKDNKKDKEVKSKTVAELLALEAGYVFPVKGFENIDTSQEKNAYIKVAFEVFKDAVKVNDENEYLIFEEYGDVNAEAFRNQLKEGFKRVNNDVWNNAEVKSYEDYVKDPLDGTIKSFK